MNKAISKELFQNATRTAYRRHVLTSLPTRLDVTIAMIPFIFGYFIDNQPDGYVSSFGGAARAPVMPTFNTLRWLEKLADYILAEDHEKGLSLRDRAKLAADKDEETPQMGSCARQYQERLFYLECIGGHLTEHEQRRVKTCEVCGCEFVDRSRAGNAKVCRYPCLETYGAIKKRRQRNSGDGRLLRYRLRQDLEYPFYSPAELREISERGETIREDIGEVISAARLRQERGRRIPTEITMDSDIGYFPNGHKRWRSEEDAEALAGEVITYNLRDLEPKEPLYLGHVA